MTEQDAEDLFIRINTFLRERGLTWLATEIAAEAAEGKASPKMLAVQEHFETVFPDEIPSRPTRHKTEFTSGNHFRGAPKRIVVEMCIPRGSGCLCVSQQPANDRQAQPATGTEARIGVPEIVQAYSNQTSPFG